jgi:hypothetical protein
VIQITRAQARQLRAVLRKSLPPGSARSYHPPLSLTAGEEGLRVRVHNPEAAIEWTIPGPRSTESMTLPSAALDDFEGRHESLVNLIQKDADNVQASAQDLCLDVPRQEVGAAAQQEHCSHRLSRFKE